MRACVRANICASVPVSVRACVCACVSACVSSHHRCCDPDVTLDLGRLTHGIVLLGELNCMYQGTCQKSRQLCKAGSGLCHCDILIVGGEM